MRCRKGLRLPKLPLLLLAGIAVVTLALQVPGAARLADTAIRELNWAERYVRLRLGWPLRGTPDLARFEQRLAAKGLEAGDPVFIRIFKREWRLELWMKKERGFVLFAAYPVCRWSGRLGPKLQEGDGQSPEGFYTVSRAQLNPDSRWHLSFNLGFPNAYDRARGRTGSYLMVHGGCGSIGCYAMTDPVIDEIWRLVTAAFDNGQERFAVHVFPFRLTDAALSRYRGQDWHGFWRDLKPGYDLFEETRVPPRVSVCERRYTVRKGKPGGDGSVPVERACPDDLAGS